MSTTTSRNKTLIFIIAALLLTNIAVLAYFLWIKEPQSKPKPKSDRQRGLTDMLQKEVGFSDTQVAQYEKLRTEQWAAIKPMFDQMRKTKDSLFRLMSNPDVNDSVINKAADAIAQKQKALDLQTFNHFKKVRAICTPDQQVKYDSAVLRMFSRMGRPAKKNDDKDKDKTEKDK